MVLKSLKSKIAVGVIGVSLVAGMSTVFAGVDAGAQFKAWYGALFLKTSVPIQANAASNYASQLADYTKGYGTLKDGSKQAIKDEVGVKTTSASSTINGQKSTYISQIEGAQNKIDVAGDFAKLTDSVNKGVDFTTNVTEGLNKRDLDFTLNKQGQASVADVNKNVSDIKKSATDELTTKINEAKAEIQELVTAQSQAADQAIRDHIDAQIAALKQTISDYAAQLVTTNKNAVDAEGDKVQKDALAELDKIAASIIRN